MPVDAKTIQIFLPNGEPQGIRIAEITTRLVQAIQVPRARLTKFLERPESHHVGLYFLLGEREETVKPLVYVGQTEDLVGRLKIHHANKEFWNTAVVIVSRTHSFTQAHIRYLEWHSIKVIGEAGRFDLDNGNSASKPHLPEAMEADVLDAFETTGILLATLGFPIFDPPTGRGRPEDREIFYCSGPHADARGSLVDDGFVVYAGSTTRRKAVPSSQARFAPWIEQLQSSGILEAINDEELRLTQDYLVNSPSYAAALVLARHANGWQEWKRADGLTLHEVYREATGVNG